MKKNNFIEMERMEADSDTDSDSIERIKHLNREQHEEDYEESDETSPMLTETPMKFLPEWDIFIVKPWDNSRELDEKAVKKWLKVFKIITYLIIFISMIIFLFLSKISLLLASTNIRAYPQDYGNLDNVSNFSASLKEQMFQRKWIGKSRPTLQCYNYSFYYPVLYNDSDIGKILRNITWPGTFCMLMPYNWVTKRFTPQQLPCTDVQKWHPKHVDPLRGKKFNSTSALQHFYATPCISVHFRWMWAVFLMISLPYAAVFCRCFWKNCFRTIKSPSFKSVIATLLVDGLHTAGLSYMLFYILPGLNDALEGVILLTGVGLVPACLALTNKPSGIIDKTNSAFDGLKMSAIVVLNIIAAGLQLSVGGVMTWKMATNEQSDKAIYCAIIPCLFCISLRWWENYSGDNTSPFSSIPFLARLASEMKRSRPKLQLFSSLFRILVTFATLIWSAYLLNGKISPGDTNKWYNVIWMQDIKCSRRPNETIYEIDEGIYDNKWISMWTLNVFSGFIVYFLASVSAKMQIQRLAVAFPVMISVPVTAGLMIAGCQIWNDNPCNMSSSLFNVTYFYRCYQNGALNAGSSYRYLKEFFYFFPVWWLSLLWVTRHMWFPKSEKLAKMDKIFVLPMFDGTLIGESIMLNRNRNDRAPLAQKALVSIDIQEVRINHNQAERGEGSVTAASSFSGKIEYLTTSEIREKLTTDTTPMVYICATMWHENETEMIQMLKSIFRLDRDQASRTLVYHLGKVDADYYNFEAHIFFDNAMNSHEENEEYTVNEYVHLLVKVLKEAAHGEHGIPESVKDPTKYPTPYGGRLEYILPGENKLIVHLKDNAKIRNKKRWSQVMYMYYFLGHRLSCNPDLTSEQKIIRSRNTYLLALDGDVDFQPLALILLIDLMRRQEKVGAVCGRIHPIGTGPMVWYQEFEYAIGHWLQKAAEHVMGCVLCSPGCFSLFRGSAIMDENVMKTYTKMPTEPRHHVQYDQGEDRWLCTLLLQQGYRVEYCAASDSFTYCPENFNEFFNQRRRWMPSTMSNILDLIESWKHTSRVNENISVIYIIYQASILFTSLLSPGIIYLMIIGATDEAIKNFVKLDFWWLAVLNAIPLVIFVILCFKASSDVQLMFAKFLAGVYIIIQIVVLIGTCVTMYRNNWCYSTTMFFLGLTAIFIIAGLLHPQEFLCLPKGIFYYISIPTMYMILMTYAILNLHVVSWGTRETKKTAKQIEEEEARLQALELKKKEKEAKKKGIVFDILDHIRKRTEGIQPKKDYCNCTRTLCNVICCSKPDHPPNEQRLEELIERVDTLETRFNTRIKDKKVPIKSQISIVDHSRGSMYQEPPQDENSGRKPSTNRINSIISKAEEPDYDDGESVFPDYDNESHYDGPEIIRDELINPSWLEDQDLGNGPKRFISEEEVQFFQGLIQKYLYPLIKDKVKEEESANALKELRNKVAGGFIFANFTFALVTIIAQSNAKDVYVPWPCPAKDQGDGKENLSRLNDNFSKVDMSGIIFLAVFGACVVLQFIAMFIHRLGTFMHLMSTTELCSKKKSDDSSDIKSALEITSAFTNLDDGVDDDEDPDYDLEDYDGDDSYSSPYRPQKRQSGFEKAIKDQKRNQIQTYSQAVIKRLKQLEGLKNDQLPKDKAFKAATKNATVKKALMTVRHNLNTLRQRQKHFDNYGFEKISVRNTGRPRGSNDPTLGRSSLTIEDQPRAQGRFIQHKQYGKSRLHDFSQASIRSNDASDQQFPF